MAFLGKIGKSLGIGDLTHQPLKALTRIGATVGGALIGGPEGAAIGNGLSTAVVGDQNGSRSIRADLTNAALAYGATSGIEGGIDYVNGAGGIGAAVQGLPGAISDEASAIGSDISGAASSAGQALGLPASVTGGTDAAAAAATTGGAAAGSSADLLDPSLTAIDTTAGGTLPASTAAATGAPGSLTALNTSLPAATAPQSLLGKAGSFLSNNGRTIASLAPVALDVARGNSVTSQQKALEAQANQLSAQGNQLTNTLNSGNLPAGLQQNFDQALTDAQTSIKTKYANLGLAGSSMEAQELQSANERVQALKSQQIQSLAETGLQEVGSSSDLYKAIMQQNLSSDEDLSKAIADAVGSLGGAPPAAKAAATT